jgi:hypothetical protein
MLPDNLEIKCFNKPHNTPNSEKKLVLGVQPGHLVLVYSNDGDNHI